MLSILDLFDEAHPSLTAEQIQRALGSVSVPTVYRYLQALAKAGLVVDGPRSSFVLGPRIVELDRQAQHSDPLLDAGRRVILTMKGKARGVALLCRFYGNKVLCIHSRRLANTDVPTSFERGRPIPLFRGATSKVILASLPAGRQAHLYRRHADDIREAGLGEDINAFKASLGRLRKQGFAVAQGEIDRGVTGVAVPLIGPDRQLMGSLSIVLRDVDYTPTQQPMLVELLKDTGEMICATLDEDVVT